jgi:hypothetical protein
MAGVEHQSSLLDYGDEYHCVCDGTKLSSPSEASQLIPGCDHPIVDSAIIGSTTEQALKDFNRYSYCKPPFLVLQFRILWIRNILQRWLSLM